MFTVTGLKDKDLLLHPNSPGRGASFHLDIAPTHWLPPLASEITSLVVLNLLTRSLPAPGFLRHMPVVAVYLVCLNPLFCQYPAPRYLSAPRGSPLRGYLPPSAYLHQPHIRSSNFRP